MKIENTDKLESLISLLKEEHSLYMSEYEIVEKRVELIKDKKMNELNELIEKEKILGASIAEKEKKRINLMEFYGRNLSLRELAYGIDNEIIRNNLLELREKLLDVLERIRAKNDLASQLIDVSSKMLDTMLKEAAGEKELGYNRFSQKSSVINNNLLNTRG